MLELRGVSKLYSSIPAVEGVSFCARAGQATGYLGANGSGKSTTIKMVVGLIQPTSGEVLFNGTPIHADIKAYKRRVGYVPEELQLYTHLSGLEYLTMVAQLRDLTMRTATSRIELLLRLFSLFEDRHVGLSSYSKGMRQKVLLAGALLHNPDVLVLDEPFSGLDIGSAFVLRSLIRELASRGKVIVLSAHELDIVEQVCSHVVILHRGRVVADDSIAQLRGLMALPNLEAIFAQLAIEQDHAAIARTIADAVMDEA